MASILKLEDERLLRESPPPLPPPPPPVKGRKVVPPPPPPPPADLTRLLGDEEARVRRRAALAVGRVGLRDGISPLVALLSDADPEVRQMAAFALGLIGDRAAVQPLTSALADQSPLMQGSAAEALGLIGDPSAADAIGRLAQQIVQSGALGALPPADEDARRDTPAAAFRLALSALVRLKAFEPLRSAVLDAAGAPLVRWWPVAFALQRIGNPGALAALRVLARDAQPYTQAFAVKGLGELKDRASLAMLLPLVGSAQKNVAIEAVRALGKIGDPSAAPALLKLVQTQKSDAHLRLEAVQALGSIHADGVFDTLLDSLTDPNPSIRAAAFHAAAAFDPDAFITVLSGIDPDPSWNVRSALASALALLKPEAALPRLTMMLGDSDQRVVPAVLDALITLHAPSAPAILLERLKADDPVVRAAAARGLGSLKPAGGAAALADAYRTGQRDPLYVARAAALDALVKYGAADAKPTLEAALADKDWAVRVKAARLMKSLDPAADVEAQIRPAPTTLPAETYAAARVTDPSVSTEIYIDTDRGTIQIELAVLDAPLTAENFVRLARKGFFDGVSIHRVVPDFVVQDGDPRGDGEGGPGFTIRDELNERPYLRGTVGMALDWADTGGSQFFITHSPQPHLDAKYTVFGRVVSGMEVVDQIQQWDVIRRVRVWDGTAK